MANYEADFKNWQGLNPGGDRQGYYNFLENRFGKDSAEEFMPTPEPEWMPGQSSGQTREEMGAYQPRGKTLIQDMQLYDNSHGMPSEDVWRDLYARRESGTLSDIERRQLTSGANLYHPGSAGMNPGAYVGTYKNLPDIIQPGSQPTAPQPQQRRPDRGQQGPGRPDRGMQQRRGTDPAERFPDMGFGQMPWNPLGTAPVGPPASSPPATMNAPPIQTDAPQTPYGGGGKGGGAPSWENIGQMFSSYQQGGGKGGQAGTQPEQAVNQVTPSMWAAPTEPLMGGTGMPGSVGLQPGQLTNALEQWKKNPNQGQQYDPNQPGGQMPGWLGHDGINYMPDPNWTGPRGPNPGQASMDATQASYNEWAQANMPGAPGTESWATTGQEAFQPGGKGGGYGQQNYPGQLGGYGSFGQQQQGYGSFGPSYGQSQGSYGGQPSYGQSQGGGKGGQYTPPQNMGGGGKGGGYG